MNIKCFEDTIAWQKSQRVTIELYKLLKGNKDFSFKDQICRASVSVSNNIAEGFDRQSDKEFARFLYISCGSSSEVKSMLYLAEELSYIPKEKCQQLKNESNEISKIIKGFIKSLTK